MSVRPVKQPDSILGHSSCNAFGMVAFCLFVIVSFSLKPFPCITYLQIKSLSLSFHQKLRGLNCYDIGISGENYLCSFLTLTKDTTSPKLHLET